MNYPTISAVRCPNCGSYAEKRELSYQNLTQTACSRCDYLMISCQKTGKVVEAYAPGITVNQ